MTLPSERVNAVKLVRQFLLDLCNPKKTPRVPSQVRREAARRLKHYPGDYYLNDIFNDYHKNEVKWEKENLGE